MQDHRRKRLSGVAPALVAGILTFAGVESATAQQGPGPLHRPPPSVQPAISQAQNAPNNGAPPSTTLVPQGDFDPSGQVATVQPNGTAAVSGAVFAESLGSNGRSCVTCHVQAQGWSITPTAIQASFQTSNGQGPLFRAVDGATCPSDDLSSTAAQLTAYSLLLNKALIRIALPLPSNGNFAVSNIVDPYNCSTAAKFGLTSSSTGLLSFYRRPLPATNLKFTSAIMWDGRETSLSQQAIDATLIHAQAANPPSAAQIAAIVAFETAHFTAQSVDNTAQALNDAGATGGPVALAASATALFPSFQAWANLPGNDAESVARRSIARGEQLFNTRPFQITNVAGLTQPGQAISGNCRSCHNANGANGQAFVDIGVTGPQPPALDVSGLPVFTLVCKTDGTIATVTDPGRAMVTGQCADIGKTKIPTLRALAARAPYFHNGSAARLTDVVGFYDRRFRIGLSPQERADLVAYLSAL